MSNLYFFIGPARAGKTTESKNWLTQHPDGIHIEFDKLREQMYGQEYYFWGEHQVWTNAFVIARYFLSLKKPVLLDDTFTTEASIADALRLDINANIIWVPNFETYRYPGQYYEFGEELIKRGRNTKGEKIVAVSKRHLIQTVTLALYGENLEYLRTKYAYSNN